MNTTELKKLAEQCICHPISRSTTEVENAGEAILSLLALNAELVDALEMIHGSAMDMRGEDFNLSSDQWRKVHAALAKAEGGEL